MECNKIYKHPSNGTSNSPSYFWGQNQLITHAHDRNVEYISEYFIEAEMLHVISYRYGIDIKLLYFFWILYISKLKV